VPRTVAHALLVIALIVAAPAGAAAAGPDRTGRVVNGFDVRHVASDQAIGALVDEPDGDIVAAGPSGVAHRLTLARYMPDGRLDRSFGSGGVALLPSPPRASVQGLLRRPDGRFVAVVIDGSSPDDPVDLVGITPRGAVDESFGSGGVVSLPGSTVACVRCHSAALDGAGAILIALRHDGRPAIARVTASGALDPGFGGGGFAEPAGVGSLNVAGAEPGGDIFALGETTGFAHTVLLRLSPSGVARPDYGNGGVVTIPENTFGDLLALGAGRVLAVASNASQNGSGPAVVRRYLADGSVDLSYGNDGATTLQVAALYPQLLARPGGGTDVFASIAGGGGQLARLDQQGLLSTPPYRVPQGFGGGSFGAPARGKVSVTFSPQRAGQLPSFEVAAAAERTDGGIVLGGDAAITVDDGGAGVIESGSWGLQSLRPDLTFDPGFGARQSVHASVRLRRGSAQTALRRTGGVPVSAALTDRGEIEVWITARRHGRTITVGHRTIVFLAATRAKLRIPVTRAGRQLLHHDPHQRLTETARATIVAGESRRLDRHTLTLR
jgi:uncharacterized delta-60 repeat protein